MSNNNPVRNPHPSGRGEIKTPVGVIAAQSIGEPGTQLTLRTKHTGGVVGVDVTQGLPRIEELFEARTPKILSPLAEISGRVKIDETESGNKVTITSVAAKPKEEREYLIPKTSKLAVEEGQLVDVGTQLASGSLDIKEILSVRGLRASQRMRFKMFTSPKEFLLMINT